MNDFHVGDMAAELAEREALLAPLGELVERGKKGIREDWERFAEEHPDAVRTMYNILFGQQE